LPNVPNLPGVPPLASYGASNISLVVADVIIGIRSFIPTWGIYFNGLPIITPANLFTQQISPILSAVSTIASLFGVANILPVIASMVEFEYAKDAPISSYKQQSGGFQSYDKVQMPFDVKVKLACGGSPSQRQAFEGTLDGLLSSTTLVDILTPEKVFTSVNCKHVSFVRRADNGANLIVADVWFEEVRVTSTSTFTTTQVANAAGQQSIGNVQPQTPDPDVQKQFSASSLY
jgi:hypothetical protein